MIIQVLGQHYDCGCNRGLFYHDSKDLLKNLNSVIEWDKTIFPHDLKDGGNPMNKDDYFENKKYLGDQPELKPGNIFYWDSNIFAIDSETRLIVLESESGFLSVKRFVEEILGSELLLLKNYGINKVDVDKLKDIPNPTKYEKTYIPPYQLLKLWKEKYLLGRIDENEWPVISLTGDGDNYFIPLTFYVKGWKVYYSGLEFDDEDMIKDCFIEFTGWLYKNNERLVIPEKKSCVKEQKE